MDTKPDNDTYLSIFLKFLKFGFMAWGGPVAQINMIREELVEQKLWVSPEKFKRVLAVYQALPGPEAHELCVYFGMIRKGRWGGFLAGLGFMLPGFILILALAYAYQLFGATVLLPLFVGIGPAVAALIVRALHRLGKHTLTDQNLWVVAAVSGVLSVFNVHFMLIFLLCISWQVLRIKYKPVVQMGVMATLFAGVLCLTFLMPDTKISLPLTGGLFIEGLKAGLLSFGGAYTAIPFLNDSMVGYYDGITQKSFLDGIALSNIIPAPLVIFGTFLGFLADGFVGAVLMTLGIFIPAFSFTLLGHGYLEKVIENHALHSVLEGISAAVIGLLAVTAAQIFIGTVTGIYPALIFVIAFAGLYYMKTKWAAPLVIIGCGVLGQVLLLAT
jgi:chromate transporter